ncbi:MAG: YbaB/EbfC family nucleoid-associated protein [Bacteroidota bacterium]
MSIDQLKEIKQQFSDIQNKIVETIHSKNSEVEITINGNIQITELKIKKDLPPNLLESLLKETINTGIKTVSEKITSAIYLL